MLHGHCPGECFDRLDSGIYGSSMAGRADDGAPAVLRGAQRSRSEDAGSPRGETGPGRGAKIVNSAAFSAFGIWLRKQKQNT